MAVRTAVDRVVKQKRVMQGKHVKQEKQEKQEKQTGDDREEWTPSDDEAELSGAGSEGERSTNSEDAELEFPDSNIFLLFFLLLFCFFLFRLNITCYPDTSTDTHQKKYLR